MESKKLNINDDEKEEEAKKPTVATSTNGSYRVNFAPKQSLLKFKMKRHSQCISAAVTFKRI